MGNGHIGTTATSPVDRLTDTSENITFQRLRWRAVIRKLKIDVRYLSLKWYVFCSFISDQPHNPLINSGAIVTNSLIKPKLHIADRFDFVSKMCRCKKFRILFCSSFKNTQGSQTFIYVHSFTLTPFCRSSMSTKEWPETSTLALVMQRNLWVIADFPTSRLA